jgi:hypothetical protein
VRVNRKKKNGHDPTGICNNFLIKNLISSPNIYVFPISFGYIQLSDIPGVNKFFIVIFFTHVTEFIVKYVDMCEIIYICFSTSFDTYTVR